MTKTFLFRNFSHYCRLVARSELGGQAVLYLGVNSIVIIIFVEMMQHSTSWTAHIAVIQTMVGKGECVEKNKVLKINLKSLLNGFIMISCHDS
jgi:hypothetical protein